MRACVYMCVHTYVCMHMCVFKVLTEARLINHMRQRHDGASAQAQYHAFTKEVCFKNKDLIFISDSARRVPLHSDGPTS